MTQSHISFGGVDTVVCILFLVGCQTQEPRLPAYIGQVEGLSLKEGPHPESLPSAIHQVGVLVISDSFFPNAAPSLSSGMKDILENRLVKKMNESFGLKVLPVRIEHPVQPTGNGRLFTQLMKTHHLDFLLLALFSSREVEGHTEIGAESMMNRMSGIEITNVALVELALLQGDSGNIALQAEGTGSSSMEQLAAPIGEDYPRKKDARDILRANAAEKALDQALLMLQRQWSHSLVNGRSKTPGEVNDS